MKTVKEEIKEESFSSTEVAKSEINDMFDLIDYKNFVPKLENMEKLETAEDVKCTVELNHKRYKPENLAEIPEFRERDFNMIDDDDFDDYILQPIDDDSKFTHNDMCKLMQETKLPTEVAFALISFNNYKVDDTIHLSKEYVVPNLIPQFVHDIFLAKVAETRDSLKMTKKKSPHCEFYLASLFRNVVDPKLLVENYYNEKNKIGSLWRAENEKEKEMTDEERVELEEKMKASKISIVECEVAKKLAKKRRNQTKCGDVNSFKVIDLATHLQQVKKHKKVGILKESVSN